MWKQVALCVISSAALAAGAIAAEPGPAPSRIQKELKPIQPRIKAPALGASGAQSSTPAPQVSVVSMDLRPTGYTIQVRNDGADTSPPISVNTFKGSGDKPYASPAGGIGVPALAPGASAQVEIDQPAGWHVGYSMFTVLLTGPVNGQNQNLAQRSMSIPQF